MTESPLDAALRHFEAAEANLVKTGCAFFAANPQQDPALGLLAIDADALNLPSVQVLNCVTASTLSVSSSAPQAYSVTFWMSKAQGGQALSWTASYLDSAAHDGVALDLPWYGFHPVFSMHDAAGVRPKYTALQAFDMAGPGSESPRSA